MPEKPKKNEDNDFDIIGIEDALSDNDNEEANLKVLEMQAKQADANVVLVHGAFGCGKSYLLVAIIRFVCTLLDQIGEEETKILVCALTNVAVDRILLTLKEQDFTDFARVGSLKKINKQILPFTHHGGSSKNKGDKDALKELNSMLDELNS
jgi:hypothetical protein